MRGVVILDSGCLQHLFPYPRRPRKCEDHRLISLIRHSLKILLKIIHRWIYKNCESVTSDIQFGFRQGLGTRETIVASQVWPEERCMSMFYRLWKAFDKAQYHIQILLLRKLDINQKDICCIKNFNWYQTAKVKVNSDLTSLVKF